ncbi:MAG: hypothetical protein AAF593_16680 [Planctomycetota bacterium]
MNPKPVHLRGSSQRVTSCLLFLLCASILHGCGNYFPPSPTKRGPTAQDLVGTWSYTPLVGIDTQITFELRHDGSFHQTVIRGNKQYEQAGRWHISGSDIHLDQVLTGFTDWRIASDETWTLIDRKESPSGFSILGGSSDPDLYVVFDWVKP